MDFNTQYAPIRDALKALRRRHSVSGSELSLKAGRTRTWLTEVESGRGTANPTVIRMAQWAQAVGAQEFGLYVVIDGEYINAPFFGDDDEEQNGTED